MIISHKYKYVFVELPQTGCSAVATELMRFYDGERIYFKHVQYHEFLKHANAAEKKYFTFSSIRNPMDIVVSKYFKYKTDHENYKERKIIHGRLRKLIMPSYENKRRDFIIENNANFEEFFFKFYTYPYSSWSILGHKNFNYILRFENLSEDFKTVLNEIDIELVRELPVFNKTKKKGNNFIEYYESEEIKRKAIKIFGPYMSYWGYDFPKEWKDEGGINYSMQEYNFVNFFRKIYWKFLR